MRIKPPRLLRDTVAKSEANRSDPVFWIGAYQRVFAISTVLQHGPVTSSHTLNIRAFRKPIAGLRYDAAVIGTDHFAPFGEAQPLCCNCTCIGKITCNQSWRNSTSQWFTTLLTTLSYNFDWNRTGPVAISAAGSEQLVGLKIAKA